MLSILSTVFGGGAAIAALVSAWFWWRSSQVHVVPSYAEAGQIEPVDPIQSQISWVVGIIAAGQEAARRNRTAAIWAAVAAFLTAVSLAANLLGY